MPYQNLRALPFYQGKADELMAQYWQRRAVRAEASEDRDRGLLWRLVADTLKTTETRQREIGRLVGADFNWLLATYRHAGGITAVAFSPDGERVVTASWDHHTARLWSARTGAPIGAPMQHRNSVNAVAFSPDGDKVVTGSSDYTARLWSAQSGAPIGEPMQHESRVIAVAFSPDGKTIMAATEWWVHLSSVVSDTTTLVPKASRLLSGTWTDAYRFLDPSGNQMQVAVRTTGNAVRIDTLRFDIPNAPPLPGDPKTLLEEWQRKLALKFDENGKIVPRYPVEVVRKR